MFDFVICSLTNFFRIVLIDRFVSIFLGENENNKISKKLVCICFFIINTALYWTFHTAWINIFSNLIGICAIVRVYTKSVKTNIFVTCSIYLINCGCDVAVYSLFTNYQDGKTKNEVYAVIVLFLILICEFLTEKLITISQKYETEMLEQKAQVYANQLNVIRQSEEKIKALRHDMKHHMNEIRLLANRYHAEEIEEYIDCMEKYIQNPNEIVSSGNMEIDSVLNYMLQKARDELENVTVKVMLPEKMKHAFDINVLIGNLLENAIEAAVQTEQKYLKVDIALKKGVLKIRIENSFLPEMIKKREAQGRAFFLSTKKEKEQHGFGLRSVERIVKAYNGTMEVTPQNDIFCVNLILYMPKP